MSNDLQTLEIARMLRISGREIARKRDENAAMLGLTSAQADSIVFIKENPGCRISDLMEHLSSSHQAACTMTDRLRDKGLIESSISQTDARVRTLTLTPLGLETYEEFMRKGMTSHTHLLDQLSDEEMDTLHTILKKLVRCFPSLSFNDRTSFTR